MMVRSMKLCSALVGAGLLALSVPAFAAPSQGTAPAADVATLTQQLQAAISDAQSKFTPGESEGDKEAAIQAAISNTIAASGFDAITTQAALQNIQSGAPLGSPVRQAANSALRTVAPAATQEASQATSVATSGSSSPGATGGTAGGFAGGSGGAGGGGGGYVVGH